MAFSDFDVSIGISANTYVGGNDASQQVNASLASPLTLQGADCRVWTIAETDQNGRSAHYMLDDTAHPNFTSIPDTKAVSVRAWVRKTAKLGNTEGGIGIFAKGVDQQPSGLQAGYVLFYGDSNALLGFTGNYDTLSLHLKGPSSGGIRQVYANITTLPVNTWHQIRMDVIPVLNGASVDSDTVRVYTNTGTEASPVWNLEAEYTFLLTEPYAHPWGTTDVRVGMHVELYGENFPTTPPSVYMDTFQALLKDR